GVRCAAGEKVQACEVRAQSVQFPYSAASTFHFMNTESFDQFELAGDKLGDDKAFLKEGIVFFQAEDGIRAWSVTGVQTCALPISRGCSRWSRRRSSPSVRARAHSKPRASPAIRTSRRRSRAWSRGW